jgi:hypothetical protein
MAHCLGVVQGVEVVGDVFWSEACISADELADVLVTAVEPLGVGVDLDAVASRQHDDLGEIVGRTEVGQRLRDVVGRDRHPLKHSERESTGGYNRWRQSTRAGNLRWRTRPCTGGRWPRPPLNGIG